MKFLQELGFKSIEQILWIDIETAPVEKELTQDSPYWGAWEQKVRWDEKIETNEDIIQRYKEKAGLYKEFSKIVSVSYGRAVEDGRIITVKNLIGEEKDIIEELFADVEKFVKAGVKFLGGFSCKQYDVPFVSYRATVNDVPIISSFDIGGLAPWNIKHIIDVQDILRGTSMTTVSLEGACASFGIPSPKEGAVSASTVGEAFWAGKIKDIAEYNDKDILATCNVFCKYIQIGFFEMVSANGKKVEVVVEGDIFQRLYQTKDFNEEVQAEFLSRLKTKKIKKADRPKLKELLLASYLEKVPLMGSEKKGIEATNKERIAEVEEFWKKNKL